MPQLNSFEGIVPFAVPGAGKDCFTWYKVFGQLPGKDSKTVPLIALHGGPGAGHEYLLSLQDLTTNHQIPVILYDQVGCGHSTALPERKGYFAFWTVDLFERELQNLISHFGFAEYDLFGHSWGGMLASVFASKHPQGLRKLILMGAPASVDLVLKGSAELRTQLPRHLQDAMQHHEQTGEFDAPNYKEACLEFYKRFLCRLDPWPQELSTSLGHLEEDPTVYGTM